MFGSSGLNVGGPHLVRWSNVGNPHRPDAALLVGSMWDKHDGSTSGQRMVNVCSSLYLLHLHGFIYNLFLYLLVMYVCVIFVEDGQCANGTSVLLPPHIARSFFFRLFHG